MNSLPPVVLNPAFIRLEDAHKQWHQAEDEYFDPSGFRLALNSCIQTLRSVTFVLQKQKNKIEGFETWYQDWQKKLSADDVLKWSVQARNQIVKEGDLELRSILRVSVVASYFEPPYQEFQLSPISRTKDILDNLKPTQLPQELFKHGYLRLERRWVVEDLPSYELLDAIAHCYSTLSLLLHDAWRAIDSNAPKPPLATGGLPCMVRSDEDRSVWIKLSTGKIEPIAAIPAKIPDTAKQEKILARYGKPNIASLPSDLSDLKKMALQVFNYARVILEKDGYHDFIVFLLLPDNRMEMMKLSPENQGDKYRLLREVAARVAQTDASGVIAIGEVWTATYDPAHPLRFAGEYPNRSEALHLAAIAKSGEEFALIASFMRKGKRIILNETEEQELGKVNFLEPIQLIWKK